MSDPQLFLTLTLTLTHSLYCNCLPRSTSKWEGCVSPSFFPLYGHRGKAPSSTNTNPVFSVPFKFETSFTAPPPFTAHVATLNLCQGRRTLAEWPIWGNPLLLSKTKKRNPLARRSDVTEPENACCVPNAPLTWWRVTHTYLPSDGFRSFFAGFG